MSAADAPTKSAASIETQLAANNAVDNDVLPVEDQPVVDINPINMATSTYGNTATMRLGDTADTCHSSTSNTKGKHPEYPGHNQPAMAIPNNASSISYIHAIDTTQFGHNRDKTGNGRNMTFKANPQHLYGQQSLNGSLPCTASTMRYGNMDGNIPRRKERLEEPISLLCNI
jgi:hypothetical protein